VPTRSRAEWLAIALLVMEGIPGVTVGVSLAPAIAGGGLFLVVGIVGYGIASLAGAAGIVLGRRWGWPVALITVLAGLAILVAVLGIAGGRDEVIWGGIAIWVVTLAALIAARPRRRAAG
jgi:hypothetical protein